MLERGCHNGSDGKKRAAVKRSLKWRFYARHGSLRYDPPCPDVRFPSLPSSDYVFVERAMGLISSRHGVSSDKGIALDALDNSR